MTVINWLGCSLVGFLGQFIVDHVINLSLTTHPFRNGAPLVLLMEELLLNRGKNNARLSCLHEDTSVKKKHVWVLRDTRVLSG